MWEIHDNHLNGVAAPIVIIRRMERLMKVTYEMKDELERHKPFLCIRPRCSQLCLKLLDLVYRTIFRGTV